MGNADPGLDLAVAAKGDKRWDRLLAVWSGAGARGRSCALSHLAVATKQPGEYRSSPKQRASASPSFLPKNTLLYGWGAASALSIAVGRRLRRERRWALLGLAALPLLRRSAEHHFSWIVDQAATRPAWWNRGVQAG